MEFCWNTEQFAVLPVQPWYKKQEMIENAYFHEYEATEALLDGWIKKGLIGHAGRAGLGRGYGSVAWWSAAQFTLFVELLRARQEGKLRIGQLCAFPVWRWLYWGKLGGVALPQVRRAMGTWAASVKKTTTDIERKEARLGVEKLQGPGATGKLALIRELTALGVFQKEPDSELLRYLLQSVVTDSPFQVETDTEIFLSGDIELVATLFPLRQRAFQQYEQQIACLPDTLWEWTRTFVLFMQFQGQCLQPRLAKDKDPRFAKRYHRLTIYDVLWSVCYDVLTPLSIAVPTLFSKQYKCEFRLPFLAHERWEKEEASSQIATTFFQSSLLLPTGNNVASLRNEVTIAYQENTYHFTMDLPFV